MLLSVMISWAEGLNEADTSVNVTLDVAIESAQVEMILPSLLFCIIGVGFVNPRSNLPGNHGPMIPLIGPMALAGGHPLALSLLIGIFGLILSFFQGTFTPNINLRTHLPLLYVLLQTCFRRLKTGENHLPRSGGRASDIFGF